MKKISILLLLVFLGMTTIYALTFQFDSSKLSLSNNKQVENIMSAFAPEYTLTYKVESQNTEEDEKVKELATTLTQLVLLRIGEEEGSLDYYHRYNEFMSYRYRPDIPKDPSSLTGYDQDSQEFQDSTVSSFVVNGMFKLLNDFDIHYSNISGVMVAWNDEEPLVSVILPNVTMKITNPQDVSRYEEITTNLVIYYWFKKLDGEYKTYYIQAEYSDTLDSYFEELETLESANNKSIAIPFQDKDEFKDMYDYSKLNQVKKETFQSILDKNVDSVVLLNSYYNNELVSSAHGFFLEKGILVTSWKFLSESLRKAQYFVIKDYLGNFYDLDGIITINMDTDIVLLKLKEPVGKPVTLSETLPDAEDPIFTISSKSGTGYTLQSGIMIPSNGYLRMLLPLLDSDSGSPLFNQEGNVIGMNTAQNTNKSLSLALPKDALKEAKEKVASIPFSSIKTVSFEELKEKYYYTTYEEEKVVNTIPKKIWEEYSQIGDIENTLSLPLVKASYQDSIVSLRYRNDTPEYISNIQFASNFQNALLAEGYQEVSNKNNRYVYENEKYKVIILSNFQYLTIVMVKL